MPVYKYVTTTGKTRWEAWIYYKDFTGALKREHKRGFLTQREAKDYEKSFNTHNSVDRQMTFGQLYSAYLEYIDKRLKVTTIDNKKTLIEKFILPYFRNTKLMDINPNAISEWHGKLLEYRDEKGNPYKDTYLYSIHSQMSAILSYAVKNFGLQSNPCKVIGSIGSSKAEEMHFWTLEEFKRAMAYEGNPIYKLTFSIFYWTGIREGEMFALTPADIIHQKKKDGNRIVDSYIIRITKDLETVKGVQYIQTTKTKRSTRDVEIPKGLYDQIMDYIHIVHLAKMERLCLYTKNALNQELHRLAKNAGVTDIHVHELRHSHASLLIDRKVSISTISARLGHEKVSTTLDTYGHLYPGKDREVADDLGKIISFVGPDGASGEENPDCGKLPEKVPPES